MPWMLTSKSKEKLQFVDRDPVSLSRQTYFEMVLSKMCQCMFFLSRSKSFYIEIIIPYRLSKFFLVVVQITSVQTMSVLGL